MKIQSLYILAVFMGFCFSPSKAALAISNIDNSQDAGTSTYSGTEFSAIGFTTGDKAITLQRISYYVGSGNSSQTIVEIFSSTVGGDPDAAIAPALNFPGVASGSVATSNSMTIALAASTDYFIVFKGSPSGGVGLTSDNGVVVGSDSEVGTGWALGNRLYRYQGGSWNDISNNRPLIQIEAVPEPSTVSLFLVGGATLFLRRRK